VAVLYIWYAVCVFAINRWLSQKINELLSLANIYLMSLAKRVVYSCEVENWTVCRLQSVAMTTQLTTHPPSATRPTPASVPRRLLALTVSSSLHLVAPPQLPVFLLTLTHTLPQVSSPALFCYQAGYLIKQSYRGHLCSTYYKHL